MTARPSCGTPAGSPARVAGSGGPEMPGKPLRPTKAAPVASQRIWLELDPRVVAQLSPNSRSQSHWPRTVARQAVMQHVKLVAAACGLEAPGVPVEITFRWVVPTRVRRDVDNCAANGLVKATIDALVKAEYLADDSTRYVTAVHTEVVWQKGCRWIEVVIAQAPGGQPGGSAGEG